MADRSPGNPSICRASRWSSAASQFCACLGEDRHQPTLPASAGEVDRLFLSLPMQRRVSKLLAAHLTASRHCRTIKASCLSAQGNRGTATSSAGYRGTNVARTVETLGAQIHKTSTACTPREVTSQRLRNVELARGFSIIEKEALDLRRKQLRHHDCLRNFGCEVELPYFGLAKDFPEPEISSVIGGKSNVQLTL